MVVSAGFGAVGGQFECWFLGKKLGRCVQCDLSLMLVAFQSIIGPCGM